jgi:hypothetical protein
VITVRLGWKKPREEFVKLNVDAGFNADQGSGSTGAIIRDEKGYFVAASYCGNPFVQDIGTTEARVSRGVVIGRPTWV